MALVTPNATMKDNMAVLEERPKAVSANWGKMERSKPIMPPTKALMMTKRVNCPAFSFKPSLMVPKVGALMDNATKLRASQFNSFYI